jgi:transaldolase
MPAKTFRQLMSHPLTDRGLEGFMRDWAEVEKAGNA